MTYPEKFPALFLALLSLLLSSGNVQVQACAFYVTNKCPFPIWPATAPNQGHPVLANGGFHLPPGKTQKIVGPGDWTGRMWARTGCNFDSTGNDGKGCCETGDCGGKLECNGLIGTPPVTLIEFTLQIDKHKPSFYDVSLVDGYNLPVQVSAKSPNNKNCLIPGCRQNLKDTCPDELAVLNKRGEVVACKSACLAFDRDLFCCRNGYGSPEKCKPTVYSRAFKEACPNYVSYAFDTMLTPLVSCGSDEYVITFCPATWGIDDYSSH